MEARSRGSRAVQFATCASFAALAIAIDSSTFWSPCPVGDSGFMIAASIP